MTTKKLLFRYFLWCLLAIGLLTFGYVLVFWNTMFMIQLVYLMVGSAFVAVSLVGLYDSFREPRH